MPDGTIYAGRASYTNTPIFAKPVDEPDVMTTRKALRYAFEFEGHGHQKGRFRLPDYHELRTLYNNRAKIGGFNETGAKPEGVYVAHGIWSFDGEEGLSPFVNFKDGSADVHYYAKTKAAVRLIRDRSSSFESSQKYE